VQQVQSMVRRLHLRIYALKRQKHSVVSVARVMPLTPMILVCATVA